MRSPFLCALAAAFGLALVASPARADDEVEAPPKPRPTPPDTRSGRPTLAAGIGYQRLFAYAEKDTPPANRNVAQSDFASWGWVPQFQLEYPFTRHFAMAGVGSFGSFTSGTSVCSDCSAKTQSFGLSAVYHLVDGIPFDPWFAFTVAYRKTELTAPTGYQGQLGTTTYTGIDIARWTIGSDFYPAKAIGFGPYLDFGIGRYSSRSPGSISSHAAYTAITLVGLRVVLNPF